VDERRGPALLAELFAAPGAAHVLAPLRGVDGVYLVGGAVRDLLLGRETPVDFDLVADRDVGEIVARLGPTTRVHDRFGTATVTVGGHRLDLARARRERYPRPGALPEVQPASLFEDLRRRDFTVNALALGLARGDLHAAPRACADLEAGVLRVLHDLSFVDDPTRLLRLARYAARLRFAVAPHTAALAAAAIDAGSLATVSGARLGAELRLLAAEPDPVTALEVLRALGVDAAIAPGWGLGDPGLARRALELLPPDGDRAVTVLAAAGRAVAADVLGDRLAELAFPATPREAILAAATRAPAVARALAAARRPSQIAVAVADAAPEVVALAGALGPVDAAARWLSQLRHVALAIDGADLVAAGVPPGPPIGAGLAAARAAKLDGRISGRERELAEALRVARAEA